MSTGHDKTTDTFFGFIAGKMSVAVFSPARGTQVRVQSAERLYANCSAFLAGYARRQFQLQSARSGMVPRRHRDTPVTPSSLAVRSSASTLTSF